ncbi:MAG: histone [archaeon]
MEKNNPTLTKKQIEKIFKDRAGAENVSKEARENLLETLNEIAYDIAYYSVKYSKNEGKKTVSAENVREATKYVLGSKTEERE